MGALHELRGEVHLGGAASMNAASASTRAAADTHAIHRVVRG